MCIADIVVIAVLALFGIVGLSKGFIKQVGKLISLIVAIGAAVFLFKNIAEILYKLEIVKDWQSALITKLETYELFTVNAQTGGQAAMTEALTSIKIPSVVQNLLFKLIDFEKLPDTTLALFLSDKIIAYGCYAAAFLGLFIVALIVVSIIVKVITKAIDVVPGAGFLNRLLGMAFSVAKVLLIVWVLLYGLTFLSFVPKLYDTVNNFIATNTADSVVCKFIIEHNGVTWIVGKILGN